MNSISRHFTSFLIKNIIKFKNARVITCFNRHINSDAIENKTWISVVGLEVHAQINAKTKLFSHSPAVFGSPTNTEVSFFDAAFPGTLPVLNQYCVEAAVLTALALNCSVNPISRFDRKHYFYPDLPAGYQITQQFFPLASNGNVEFLMNNENGEPYVCSSRLKQLQLEQDSGRTFHINDKKSFIDLNRAGIALMELVFEPDLQNGTQAAALIKELILILKKINTCTCEMEEGTLRVDANVSVHKKDEPFGVRTEVKNINSIRHIAQAIDYEIKRQIEILEEGGSVVNETRAYDYQKKVTVFMRDKEILQDYRFMPEPNLPPIYISHSTEKLENFDAVNTINICSLKAQLPILPHKEREMLIKEYKISLQEADKLINYQDAKDKFEAIAKQVSDRSAICNFFFSNLIAILNVRKLSFKNCPLTASQLTEIIELIISKNITEATANDILEMMFNGDHRTGKKIVEDYNWQRISDEKELRKLCLKVMEIRPKVVKKYRNTQKQKYMTSLLVLLYEISNNRVPYKESEDMFKSLIVGPAKKFS